MQLLYTYNLPVLMEVLLTRGQRTIVRLSPGVTELVPELIVAWPHFWHEGVIFQHL